MTSVEQLHRWACAAVSIPALARKAGVSASSFYSHFRHFTRLSPLQYVKAVRLQMARQLIMDDKLKTGEIANLIGYNSPAQFSCYFGHPPVEERKQVRLSQQKTEDP